MSKELDFELVDESTDGSDEITVETNEEINPSDEESKKVDEENTSSAKSNKSNFKKMSKLNKALIAENKKLKAAEAARKKASNNAETVKDEFEDLEDEAFDSNDLRFFLLENPDAKEYSDDIKEIANNYPNLSLEDALALAKAKKPKESTSSDDFSTKSVNTKVRKKLGDLTEEEALQLSPAKFLEFQRLKGRLK